MKTLINGEIWVKYENYYLGIGITQNRQKKLKQMFGTVDRGLSMPFEDVQRNNLEDFLNKLNRDEFKQISGEAYAANSKADIKKFIKQFWKWLKGNNEFYPLEVAWIKTKMNKNDKKIPQNVLTLDDVKALAKHMNKIEYRTLVLILFDSGFRIDELRSVRKMDIVFKEYDGSEKCFQITCTRSKTEIRTVMIPLFTEDIQVFFNSAYFQGLKEDEFIWGKSYNAISQYIKDNAEKSIKRTDVHPHLFRHSSATYYADKLDGDRIRLANRYGWSYSAKELDTYVRRSCAYEKASAKKIYGNLNSENQAKIRELEAKMELLKQHLVQKIAEPLIMEDVLDMIRQELKMHLSKS